jgi:hypothetical protein
MRPLLLILALMLTACTTSVQVRGRYAAALTAQDIRQIRRLAQNSPHFGHTLITLDAVQRNRVRTQTRKYEASGWDGTTVYLVRHHGQWQVDEHSSATAEVERNFSVN